MNPKYGKPTGIYVPVPIMDETADSSCTEELKAITVHGLKIIAFLEEKSFHTKGFLNLSLFLDGVNVPRAAIEDVIWANLDAAIDVVAVWQPCQEHSTNGLSTDTNVFIEASLDSMNLVCDLCRLWHAARNHDGPKSSPLTPIRRTGVQANQNSKRRDCGIRAC